MSTGIILTVDMGVGENGLKLTDPTKNIEYERGVCYMHAPLFSVIKRSRNARKNIPADFADQRRFFTHHS